MRRAGCVGACVAAADLTRRGHAVFCPSAHSHPSAEAGGLPEEWDFWRRHDFAILIRCSRLVVLTIAFPYGVSNLEVASVAREVGFKLGFGSDHGTRASRRMLP